MNNRIFHSLSGDRRAGKSLLPPKEEPIALNTLANVLNYGLTDNAEEVTTTITFQALSTRIHHPAHVPVQDF